jgi:hypothetical protein
MYNNFISSNDDDLFNKEEKPKDNSSTINSLSDLTKTLEDAFEKETSYFVAIKFKNKIFSSLISSADEYINNTGAHNRSIFDVLNKLTNGEFGRTLYADILEEQIVRKIVVHSFFSDIYSLKDKDLASEVSDSIKLSKFVNIICSDDFFQTYILSMTEMLDHSIAYNIDTYIRLCESINRTPIEDIVTRNILSSDNLSPLTNFDTYLDKQFSAIRIQLGFSR